MSLFRNRNFDETNRIGVQNYTTERRQNTMSSGNYRGTVRPTNRAVSQEGQGPPEVNIRYFLYIITLAGNLTNMFST